MILARIGAVTASATCARAFDHGLLRLPAQAWLRDAGCRNARAAGDHRAGRPRAGPRAGSRSPRDREAWSCLHERTVSERPQESPVPRCRGEGYRIRRGHL